MIMKHQRLVWGVIAIVGIGSAAAVLAVNFELIEVASNDIEKASWPSSSGTTSITWSVNLTNSNVDTSGGGTIAGALTNGFTTWSSATYSSLQVNTLSFTQGSNSTLTAATFDCQNVVGFTESLGTGIIAEAVVSAAFNATPGFTTCTTTPTPRTCPNKVCIVDADIEFNPNYNFATYTPTPSNHFDVQSIATHEIGHLIGLDHSGLTHAVMFPYGDTANAASQQTLAVDDMIGSEVLYGSSAIQAVASEVDGTVTLGGSSAFAAHLVAIDSTTGNVITDTLSRPDGTYDMPIVAGTYYILALPLAPDLNHGPYTINNFTGFACTFATIPSTCSGLPANPTNYTGHYF